MIVDCHTHINFAADDVEVSEHLAATEMVDRCIVLAASNGPSDEVNKGLAKYVNKYRENLGLIVKLAQHKTIQGLRYCIKSIFTTKTTTS